MCCCLAARYNNNAHCGSSLDLRRFRFHAALLRHTFPFVERPIPRKTASILQTETSHLMLLTGFTRKFLIFTDAHQNRQTMSFYLRTRLLRQTLNTLLCAKTILVLDLDALTLYVYKYPQNFDLHFGPLGVSFLHDMHCLELVIFVSNVCDGVQLCSLKTEMCASVCKLYIAVVLNKL